MEWVVRSTSSIWLQFRSIYVTLRGAALYVFTGAKQNMDFITNYDWDDQVHSRHRYFEDKWRLKDSYYLQIWIVHQLVHRTWTRLWLDTSVGGTKVLSSRWMWQLIGRLEQVLHKKKKKVNITEAQDINVSWTQKVAIWRFAQYHSNSKQKIMIQCEVQNLLWRFRGKWHLKSFNTERILKVLRTEGPFEDLRILKKLMPKVGYKIYTYLLMF